MSDNTQINTGSGDLIRGLDKAGVKTQIVAFDIGGSGTESLLSSTNPLPVTGTLNYSSTLAQGLTDTQLRASAVPVSGTVALTTGALDSLSSVSVSNFPATQTVALDAASLAALETVSIANFPGTQAVSGPLTDTELRATPVPVSGTVTANSTQSQPLTDTQLRASAVPVSGSVGLTSGSSTVSITNTFSNPAAVRLSDGSTWLATLPVSLASLPALSASTANIGDVDVLSLPALSSGSAVIGAVSGDIAHDVNDTSSGVMKVGSKAVVGAAAGGLPTAVAASDRVQMLTDVYGRQAVRYTDSWAKAHLPAAGTQATCNSSAQAAGVRNVCRSITVTLSSTAAPALNSVNFSLYDGTTAGTVLWGAKASLTTGVGGNCWALALTDLWIEGSAATQMTLATAAATTTAVSATVAMNGTITQ